MSRFAPMWIGALLLAVSLAPARAQSLYDPWGGYGKFFFSPPDPPPPVISIPPETVREVLRREGVHMIGSPRLRGDNIIAMGRDGSGAVRKYTLDAPTGGLLTIVLVRAAPVRPPPPVNPRLPPRRPLGPPVHPGGRLDADHLSMAPPPPPPPDEVMPPQPPRPPPPPPPPPVDMDVEPLVVAPDAALSPIRPLRRPPGAPPVEAPLK